MDKSNQPNVLPKRFNMKKYFIVMLAVGIGLLGYLTLSDSPEHQQMAVIDKPQNKEKIESDNASINLETKKMLSSIGVFQGKPSRLIVDLNKADDYKLFALNARNFPSEGGISYAQYVAGVCWAALKIIENKAEADPARSTQAERLVKKCSGFETSANALEFSNALNPSSSEKDSFVILSKKLADTRKQANGNERLNVLTALFENPDALLLATESNRIFSLRTAASEGGSLYFSYVGERHFFNSNPPAIEALRLLPCAYGADCSSDGLLAIQYCLSEGKCNGSYHERVLSSMANNSQPQRLNEIEKFYRSIIASIDAKKATDFM
jgi:hypothetical protein